MNIVLQSSTTAQIGAVTSDVLWSFKNPIILVSAIVLAFFLIETFIMFFDFSNEVSVTHEK